MDHTEAISKLAELMKKSRIGSLATISNNQIVSRPMALQQVEFDGDLWFFCYEESNKVAEIHLNPAVNVSFESGSSWVSLSGNAVVVHDRDKSEELWNPFLKAWFPDGVDEPGLVLLKVEATSAEYWDSTSNKLVTLIGTAKAAVTGKPSKGGENETVQL